MKRTEIILKELPDGVQLGLIQHRLRSLVAKHQCELLLDHHSLILRLNQVPFILNLTLQYVFNDVLLRNYANDAGSRVQLEVVIVPISGLGHLGDDGQFELILLEGLKDWKERLGVVEGANVWSHKDSPQLLYRRQIIVDIS